MTKKSKIRITVLAIVLLLVFGFLRTFNFNPLIPISFLVTLPANQEQRDMYINSNRKNKKVKKPLKTSCATSQGTRTEIAKNNVDVADSDGYRKMRGYINQIERAANALKAIQATYDVFGEANPDAVREILPFLIEKFYEDIMALPKEADYVMIDAMCDPSLEWETKFWLSQILGDRNAKEALPLFREIAGDENEPFGLRVSVIDQIGILEDGEASNLLVELLDNNDDIMRDKASATLRDTTDQGDENIYDIISSHYYTEKDATVKECLLGSMIVIGGEQSLPEVREILKTATRGEKSNVAALLRDVPTNASFEILKDIYDPQNEDFSNFVISSLAKLEMPEANEFLYGIIEEVNGMNSVMAAEYLKDQKQKGAVPYIERALQKETNEEFIKYNVILVALFVLLFVLSTPRIGLSGAMPEAGDAVYRDLSTNIVSAKLIGHAGIFIGNFEVVHMQYPRVQKVALTNFYVDYWGSFYTENAKVAKKIADEANSLLGKNVKYSLCIFGASWKSDFQFGNPISTTF